MDPLATPQVLRGYAGAAQSSQYKRNPLFSHWIKTLEHPGHYPGLKLMRSFRPH